MIITSILLVGILLAVTITYWKYSAENYYVLPVINESGEYVNSKVYVKAHINEYGLALDKYLSNSSQEGDLGVPIDKFVTAISQNKKQEAIALGAAKEQEKAQKDILELVKYFPQFTDKKILRVFHFSDTVLFMLSAKYKDNNIFPTFTFVKEAGEYRFSSIDNQSFIGEIIGMWSIALNKNSKTIDKMSFFDWIDFDIQDYFEYSLDNTNSGFSLLFKKTAKTAPVVSQIGQYFDQIKGNVSVSDTNSFLSFMSQNNPTIKQKMMQAYTTEQLEATKLTFIESSVFSILEFGEFYVVFMKQGDTFRVGKDFAFFVAKSQGNDFKLLFTAKQTFWHRLLIYSNFNKHIVNGDLNF